MRPAGRSKALIDVNHLRIYEQRVADYIKREAAKNVRSIHQQIIYMLSQNVDA